MDGRHVDRLARSVASGPSRRRVLRLVLGVLTATLATRIGGAEATAPVCAEDGERCTL